ncbi:hypothetical protein CK203_058531 [Vitis vinifera]|uniref:Uncharacterized protein n=1 Tax=Vitis vinifera TaxID=29760 RepID=A0A438FQN0_VITVI|nr:hypothetical protein CK203_058531 [Vitis vinifera]
MEQQQQLGIEPKLVIEQFSFSGKEQPSSVLLLATLPSHFLPPLPLANLPQPPGLHPPVPWIWLHRHYSHK